MSHSANGQTKKRMPVKQIHMCNQIFFISCNWKLWDFKDPFLLCCFEGSLELIGHSTIEANTCVILKRKSLFIVVTPHRHAIWKGTLKFCVPICRYLKKFVDILKSTLHSISISSFKDSILEPGLWSRFLNWYLKKSILNSY